MKNGLEPSMALKACDSPCSLSNLYERLNKLLSEIQRENIERMCVAIRAENTPQTQREAVNRSLFGCKTKKILSPSSSNSSRGKGSIISPLTVDTSYKSSIGDLSNNTINSNLFFPSDSNSSISFGAKIVEACNHPNKFRNELEMTWWDRKLTKVLRDAEEIAMKKVSDEIKENKLRPKNNKYRSRRTGKQMNKIYKGGKEERSRYELKYKETFKEATIELNKSLLKIKAGVITDSPVLSVRQIVEKLNKKLSPSAPKIITKSTLQRYVSKGLAGDSPLRMGPPPILPPIFEEVMALHCRMIQNSIGQYLFEIVLSNHF